MRVRTMALMALGVLLAGCAPPPAGSTSGGRVSAGQVEAAGEEPYELPEAPALEDYLRLAALRNPGLRAAWYRWQAAAERPAQVTGLPNPMLSYGHFIRSVETKVGPQRDRVGISQTIPWPGKLVLAGAVARQEAEVARQRYEAAKLELFYRVKDAYYEYYYLARQTEVTEGNAELVRRLEEVVRTRYAAGAAGHPDLIRAQVELGRLEDRVKSLYDLRASAAARLNAVLGRAAGADVSWPRDPPARSRLKAGDDALLAAAATANPELAVLGAEVERDRKAVRLARQSYWPDFTVGADYIFTDKAKGSMPVDESGKDPVAVTVGLSLPIWFGRYRAAEREARDRLQSTELMRRDRENTVSARLKMVLFEVRDAERKIELYGRTLIPKAKESLVVTETAFRAGKASFLELIDAERVLLDFQLSYERALASHGQRLAELEMMLGQPVPTEAVPVVPAAPSEGAPEGRTKDSRPEAGPAETDPAARARGGLHEQR